MKVLGIDPGFTTGIFFYDTKGYAKATTIRSKNIKGLDEWEQLPIRVNEITSQVGRLIIVYRPEVVVLELLGKYIKEKYHYHKNLNTKSIIKLAMVTGSIINEVLHFKLPLFTYQAGRLATKDRAKQFLKINRVDVRNMTSHEADAGVLVWAYLMEHPQKGGYDE